VKLLGRGVGLSRVSGRKAAFESESANLADAAPIAMPSAPNVTQLLLAWQAGDDAALDKLLSAIQPELRRIARRHMAGERRGHVLPQHSLTKRISGWRRRTFSGRAAPTFSPWPPRSCDTFSSTMHANACAPNAVEARFASRCPTPRISQSRLKETADVLHVSVGTVRRDWSLARAWLYRELGDTGRRDISRDTDSRL